MEPQKLGPAGGDGGKPFDGYGIPDDARITAVHVFSEWVIDALRFDYAHADGTTGSRPPIGGLGGQHHVFYLDDDEYLTGISGRCGWYVDSIRFHTNKRVSETYGGAAGEHEYSLMAPPEYEVAGLFGRCDWYIDALGAWLRPLALRQELVEGAALLAEADAEQTAEAAEADLDQVIEAVNAEIAAEAAARRQAGAEARGEALIDLVPDLEAMGGELLSPLEAAQLEAAALDELVAMLEEEIDAEQLGAADEDTLDMAVVSLSAIIDSGDDIDEMEVVAALEAIAALEEMEPGDEETVDLSLESRLDIDPATGLAQATVTALAVEVDEGFDVAGDHAWLDTDTVPIDAVVIMRRGLVASEEAVDALEEAAVAEAIAALREGEPGEGAVDVTVYTQVNDEDSGSVATVLAVAGPAGGDEDDETAEIAVMVTDFIDDEDELAELEQEAVEGAIAALEAEWGEVEDADVAIYTGLAEDEDGQLHGAAVAVIAPDRAAMGAGEPLTKATPTGTDRGSRGPAVVQLSGTEPRPQDLQLVEGIGPKIAALLIEHGIYDLSVLSMTPIARLREILGGAGARFRLADPGTWPRQAALGAAGDWAALTQLQSELKAGRQ